MCAVHTFPTRDNEAGGSPLHRDPVVYMAGGNRDIMKVGTVPYTPLSHIPVLSNRPEVRRPLLSFCLADHGIDMAYLDHEIQITMPATSRMVPEWSRDVFFCL